MTIWEHVCTKPQTAWDCAKVYSCMWTWVHVDCRRLGTLSRPHRPEYIQIYCNHWFNKYIYWRTSASSTARPEHSGSSTSVLPGSGRRNILPYVKLIDRYWVIGCDMLENPHYPHLYGSQKRQQRHRLQYVLDGQSLAITTKWHLNITWYYRPP